MTMPAVGACLATVLIGYACGSLPFGLWLGLVFRGVDVRTIGSGNLGATNVYRSLGPALGIATLALDAAKGALPVLLVPALPFTHAFPGGTEWCRIVAGFAAVAGHVWSAFVGFRGGKGVATMTGVLLALSPAAFGVFSAVFVAAVAITGYISVGSVLGSVAFTLALAWLAPGGPRSPAFLLGLALTVVVVVRHRDNFRRLARGEERRFSLRGKPS